MNTQKMKTQEHQIVKRIIFSIFFLMLFANCSKNPLSCLNGSWAQEVSSDLEAWSAASNTYAENPTVENCNNYKSAINGYLNALEDIQDCVPGTSLSDFDGSLDEAKDELSEIDCTEQ